MHTAKFHRSHSDDIFVVENEPSLLMCSEGKNKTSQKSVVYVVVIIVPECAVVEVQGKF